MGAIRHEGGVAAAAFSLDEGHILSWGYDGTVRLWDISPLPAGNLLEVACKGLPDRDVSSLGEVNGIRITAPICGPGIPPPDWSKMK